MILHNLDFVTFLPQNGPDHDNDTPKDTLFGYPLAIQHKNLGWQDMFRKRRSKDSLRIIRFDRIIQQDALSSWHHSYWENDGKISGGAPYPLWCHN